MISLYTKYNYIACAVDVYHDVSQDEAGEIPGWRAPAVSAKYHANIYFADWIMIANAGAHHGYTMPITYSICKCATSQHLNHHLPAGNQHWFYLTQFTHFNVINNCQNEYIIPIYSCKSSLVFINWGYDLHPRPHHPQSLSVIDPGELQPPHHNLHSDIYIISKFINLHFSCAFGGEGGPQLQSAEVEKIPQRLRPSL